MHSTETLLPLANFKKLRIFPQKTNLFFQEGVNFSTFWEFLLIQLQPNTNFSSLAVFWKIIFFSKNPCISFDKTKFWTFWEVILFQSHSSANFLPLAKFCRNKISFRKNLNFFFKKTPTFWSFWEVLLFQSHCSANLLHLAIYKKITLFRNPI